jgi:hypothetical protein
MKSNTINMTLSSNVMTGTNVITSEAVPTDQLWACAIQATWTGAPFGTLKLQATADAPDLTNQTSSGISTYAHWTDVLDSSYAVSSAGDHMWNIFDIGFRAIRVVYTNANGTGTLTSLKLSAKGV